ncbi:MAG TPA: energy transducer TonB [Pyrinomonadaceae bacterium]|nr:energy transducer TonB [Pyrinomonadaceae bacterium]
MKENSIPFSHAPNYGILPLTILLAVVFAASIPALGQSTDAPGPTQTAQSPPTVQARIERARALAAAHQLSIAAGELESIRATTTDDAVRNVTSVMLMNIYLEEGGYARAESLLDEVFRIQIGRKDRSIHNYFALAGQAVNGARAHLARYRSFGINVSDSALAAEALSDLDRLRSLLERMIVQAKIIAKEGANAYDSLALLEDVVGIRLSLSRDVEDRQKWGREYAAAREGLASSQKQVASLRGLPSIGVPAPGMSPSITVSATSKPPAGVEIKEKRSSKEAEERSPADPARTFGSDDTTITAGLLNPQATKKVVPSFPRVAKNAGISGVVRVYVGVNETGKVTSVFKSEGPPVLQKAAEDAAWRWTFPPPSVAGQPRKLTGFIEFKFTP